MTTADIPAADTITAVTLQQLLGDDPEVRILDVRTGAEFETVHIPGSYNVPLDTLGEHARDLAAVDHPVVLVCQSGGRASQAHRKLAAEGKETLHILDGGMSAWQAAGGDVVHGATGRWAMDRQVRLVAGSLVVAGVVVGAALPGAQWLAAAVGAGLVYSALSNTCAMATVLSKLPYNRTERCDIAGVLAQLNASAS
jgi:rhodanese-related sulfurtransferase